MSRSNTFCIKSKNAQYSSLVSEKGITDKGHSNLLIQGRD
ncbi:hypothetical protein SPYAA216_0375 [Streptococcus pyogenes AA216]|nr:hypothetical protein SPYAA216_0375 [Streptococcus pyogenes AA216]